MTDDTTPKVLIITSDTGGGHASAAHAIADGLKRFAAPNCLVNVARAIEESHLLAQKLAEFYKFQLVPDKDYIHRLQAAHKKFARIYPLYDSDIKYEVRGYTFPFTLYAPQPVQQFVYEQGLGFFSHKGFGMLDVAGTDSIKSEANLEETYA